MNKQSNIFGSCLILSLVLFLISASCAKSPVTLTLTGIPVTQTVVATDFVSVTNNTTIVNPVASTVTTTAPPVTTTIVTTVIPPTLTITKPAPTVTQFWPPVTGTDTVSTNFFLPPLVKGQTVNYTIKNGGLPMTYYVRDPGNNVITTAKIDFGTLSISNSFTAATDGVYTIQCVQDSTLQNPYSVSFYIS
jgi:hypothetical protein